MAEQRAKKRICIEKDGAAASVSPRADPLRADPARKVALITGITGQDGSCAPSAQPRSSVAVPIVLRLPVFLEPSLIYETGWSGAQVLDGLFAGQGVRSTRCDPPRLVVQHRAD
eukprot:COSAG02_NODE_1060_length_14866_cov_3.131916_21_plen_114_part_00